MTIVIIGGKKYKLYQFLLIFKLYKTRKTLLEFLATNMVKRNSNLTGYNIFFLYSQYSKYFTEIYPVKFFKKIIMNCLWNKF